MAPKLLDTNVIKDIARGHEKAADTLRNYLKSGREIYIAQAAYNQLVNPMPQDSAHMKWLKIHYRELIKDARIKIAPPGLFASRVDVYATNPPKGQAGSLQDYDKLGRPGDMFIAAQAKGGKFELWTHDKDLAKRAPGLGVMVAEECNLGGKSGVENPEWARRKLRLDDIKVSPDGTVTRAGVGGTSGRTPPAAAGAGRLGAGRLGAGRFGPGLKAAGSSLITLGVALLAPYFLGKPDQPAIEREMKELEPKIQSLLKAKASKLAALEALGCLPFANITVTITVLYTVDPDGGYDASLPWLEREALKVDVSDQALEGEGKPVRQSGFGYYSESTPFTYSVELSVPEQVAMGLRVCKPPSVQLTSDSEIRDWLARTSPLVIQSLPTLEKIRMINRLLDGWISDADVKGIEKICANVANAGEQAAIRRAIQPRELSISDHGQRIRVRAALLRS